MNTQTSTHSTLEEYKNKDQNRRYAIALETVSPVHIGSLDEKKWHKGMNYVYVGQEKKVYILDENRFFPLLAQKYGFALEFSDIERFINDVGNKKIANLRLKDLSYFISNLNYTHNEPIRPMIVTGLDIPYIPGSSLKGAIRSALFKAWYKREAGDEGLKSSKLEERVFGKIGNNLMKFLTVGDTHFNWDETELYNSKIFNIYKQERDWVSGWKHNRQGGNNASFNERDFTTALHCIKPQTKGVLQIGVNKNLLHMGLRIIEFTPALKNSYLQKEQPLTELFKILTRHSREYLQRELAFYRHFSGADYRQELIEYVELLLERADKLENQPDKALIRLGFGSGFHSITGDWQYPDHTQTVKSERAKKYKTRRWLFSNYEGNFQFYLPGFVQLSIIAEPQEAKAIQERIILPDRARQNQPLDSDTPGVTPPPTELTPPPYKGKLKEGAKEVPAKVIAQSGAEVTFELLLEGGNQQAKARYASSLSIGSWHYVIIKSMNKGKVERVEYQKKF
jgi:hypothetical protein